MAVQTRAQLAKGDRKPSRGAFAVLSAVLLYFSVSISLVVLNKYVLSYSPVKFPFPVCQVWLQCIVTVIVMEVYEQVHSMAGGSWHSWFSTVRAEELKACVPLAAAFVAYTVTSSVCLRYVEVSFFQVVRSMCVVTGVAAEILFPSLRKGPITGEVVLSCLMVTAGFVIGSLGEIELSAAGVVFGLVSCVATVLYSAMIKRTLSKLSGSSSQIMMYNNFLSCFLLVPLIFMMEDTGALLEGNLLFDQRIVASIVTSGVLGCCMGYVTTRLVSVTSPLTHQVVGSAKACLQTLVAMWLFGQNVTVQSAVGLAVSIGGSALYAVAKNRSLAREATPKSKAA